LGISVIIPVAEGDFAWKELLPDLVSLTHEDEIILSSKKSLKRELQTEAERNALTCSAHWAPSAVGRARQLNTGARWAKSDFYWFLHADSKVNRAAIKKLRISIKNKPGAIHFFDLKFLRDGPRLTASNRYGVWLRSRLLRLPFGDQGYCMHRDVFAGLGGYCEKATYGEDHLLAWRAHQNKVKLCCVGAPLYTSARRYRTHGWLKTTTRHLALTIRQATPELLRFLRGRVSL